MGLIGLIGNSPTTRNCIAVDETRDPKSTERSGICKDGWVQGVISTLFLSQQLAAVGQTAGRQVRFEAFLRSQLGLRHTSHLEGSTRVPSHIVFLLICEIDEV